ncbi:MAG: NADH-quinone oxidoreductase subunit L [bacterium]|nr:NADH-quinone oxidoreductase subunit L [bacterium]
MDQYWWLWLIPALPLAGSLVCGVLHFLTLKARRDDPNAAGPSGLASLVAAGAVGASFVIGVAGLLKITGSVTSIESGSWQWIRWSSEAVPISVAMQLDRLSSVMTLVITGVGFLIHVFAAGYMKGDAGFAKFFSYLNLFVALMLVLVLSSNMVGMFVGWEGVGLCSYLLIGFWYEKGWPAAAAQKAFVVNRIGDAFFLIGMFLVLTTLGSLDFSVINSHFPAAADDANVAGRLTLAALFLFGGACGKSAQLPLFVWLPDAMAGPTPVSALIHAATMVTSGIYMVIRLNPVFAISEGVLLFIGVIGAVTALIAGSTAICQRDIKKVLAYSTVSQLGYMFLGLGTGAWAAALFHLVTHAFFKALLFLGAGSVIHGMHEEQDMHRMGGLKRHMPKTFFTFVAGAAALSGLPLLSGFFSKDEILAHTFAHGGPYVLLWIVGIATAAMTAFYTWRMVALTFFGDERFDPNHVHPHESPMSMTAPLGVLAVLAVLGGVLGLPPVFHMTHMLKAWIEPVTAVGDSMLHAPHLSHSTEWVLLGLGAAIALGFAHLGFHAYKNGVATDEKLATKMPDATEFLGNAWGIDRAFDLAIVQPVKLCAFFIAVVIDQFAIDGAVNACGRMAVSAGNSLRRMANGSIASYGLWMGGAAATLLLIWMWVGA